MSVQVYSIPDQAEGRRKAFLERKYIDLSCKQTLTCGGNVICYKSAHHPIPTRWNRKNPGNFQNKSVSSLFNSVPRYIIFWTKLNGRGRSFCRVQEGGTLWDYPQEHLIVTRYEKVSPFLKFEIILPLLCFLLDLLTNKHCRTWSSMINVWVDSRNCPK